MGLSITDKHVRVGRYQDLIKKALIGYPVRAFFRLKKRFKPSAGLNHLIPSRNSEVALFSPQALAIADGSVGLFITDKHV